MALLACDKFLEYCVLLACPFPWLNGANLNWLEVAGNQFKISKCTNTSYGMDEGSQFESR
jgi:hypothetical protein